LKTARLRAVIVDDEPPARRRLERLLAREPDVELVGSFPNSRDALRALDDHAADCVFLDIEMPGPSGLELARHVRDRGVRVVFVTAHAQHGTAAFDLEAVDYLLKPFDDARFLRALARVREAIALPGPAAEASLHADRLPVAAGGRIRLVDVATVDWIEADDKQVLLHVGRETLPVRMALREVEARLDPARFARVHRRAIVRLGAVAELARAFHGDWTLTLRSGEELLMSRRYSHRLKGWTRGG
jgi:two-component system LytT family response regulator